MKINKSPKKSLGQNFLRDPKILKKIADFAKIEKKDVVFEIGPGKGTLTEQLLKMSSEVIAIEKDGEMVELLKNKFTQEISKGELEIINADVLIFNFNSFIAQMPKTSKPALSADRLKPLSFSLIGNIPYYITGTLFKKVFELKNLPKSITFVVQKEVAERIIARDKKESILSISIKAYGVPKYGGVIKAGSFFPKPKVDSAIIRIENISRNNFSSIPEEKFFEILKTGFSHKRKFLIKNLEQLFTKPTKKQTPPTMSRTRLDIGEKSNNTFKYKEIGVSRRVLDTVDISGDEVRGRGEEGGEKGRRVLRDVFNKIGINEKARAEDLKVEDWIEIMKKLSY